MNEKKEKISVIRVRAHIHNYAKIRACQEGMSLKTWIERLIINNIESLHEEILERSTREYNSDALE
jgi:predicted HicB family RNase H-like nuclease